MKLLSLIISLCIIACSFSSPALANNQHKLKKKKQRKTLAIHRVTKHRSASVLAMAPVTTAAPSKSRTPVYGNSQLSNAISRLIQPLRSDIDVGIYVKSMRQGDSLFAQN